MSNVRRKFTADFKAKVALAAVREDATIARVSFTFWHLREHDLPLEARGTGEGMTEIFSNKAERSQMSQEDEIKSLHAKIGQLTVEKDFLESASKRLGLGGVKKW